MRHLSVGLLVIVLGGLGAPARATDPVSASYHLHQSTVNAGGAEVDSAGYVLNASASQRATIGTSSSPHFVLQSGFWAFIGSGLVPVLLAVDNNAITAGNVDLSWSGNNSPYDLYESTDCTSVFGGYFDTTGSNNYDDVAPPVADLVCYNVLATAPGPTPPLNP